MELADGSYHFTAYSYNTSAVTLPGTLSSDYPYPDVTLSPYVSAANRGNDLLLSKNTDTKTGYNGINLGTLQHQFSRAIYKVGSVTVIGGATNGLTINITDVKLSSNYTAKLTKSNDSFEKTDRTTDQPLSSTAYSYVYTPTPLFPTLKITGTIKNGATTTATFTDLPVTYKKTLEPGKSYTLNFNITQGLGWAGSNIYWDGTRLTFAAPGTDDKQYYQGVFFRWGSLVGISPVGDFDAGTTPIYVPTSSGETVTWTKTNLTTAQSASYSYYFSTPHTDYTSYKFDYIPYVNTGEVSLGTTSPTYDPGAFKGDICRYLTETGDAPDGNWVMPTLADFESASRSNWTGSVPNSTYWYRQPQSGSFLTSANNALTTGYPAGTYHAWTWGASYCNTATVLPASGYRFDYNG
jgi:hypothetical protein